MKITPANITCLMHNPSKGLISHPNSAHVPPYNEDPALKTVPWYQRHHFQVSMLSVVLDSAFDSMVGVSSCCPLLNEHLHICLVLSLSLGWGKLLNNYLLGQEYILFDLSDTNSRNSIRQWGRELPKFLWELHAGLPSGHPLFWIVKISWYLAIHEDANCEIGICTNQEHTSDLLGK